MATKSIVPRASGEGGLGTSSKLWKEAHHVTASFGDVSLIEDASNRLQVSGGPVVAASGLSGSLTSLSDGSSFIKQGSNVTVTSASNGAITIASTDTDTTYTAGSGLALSSTTFSARSSVAVTVSGGKFLIDGTSQQTLSLAKGVVYYFDQSDSTNATHPLRFSNNNNNSPNSPFTTGVTTGGTPGSAGAYTQVILEQDAPSVLYYYCSNHSGMGGKAETAPDALLTGDRTFANNLTVTGDLTVNGTTTTVDTTNLLVTDKLITLNDGGAASSGGGAGIEVEEDGSATGYIKVAADRAGWEFQAPGNSNTLTLDATASKTLTVAGDLTINADTTISSFGATIVDDANASAARTTLGVAIGSDVQAWDADLDTLAGMQSGAPGALALLTQAELEVLDGATVTTTELNLLDGGTDVASPTTTIVDADRFIINDNGTMTHVSASVLKTYIGAGAADDITTGDAAVTIATSAGNITLDAQGNDTDIIFKGTDGSSDTTFLTLDGSEAGAAAFNSNVTVGGDLAVNGDTSTFASANASDPLVIIKNTTNDAAGARLRFVKDKGAAGADDDVAGLIEFYADDDNQDNILFAKVEAAVADASNGAEGGKLTLSVATHDGEIQPGLVLTDGSAEDEVDVTIGNGAASVTTVAGDAKVTGDIILDDGGSLKEAGGTAAFTFDGDGHVTKIGQDSPSSGQFLKWDGSKAVWDAASGGGGAGGGKHGLTTTKTADFTTTAFASAEERQLYIVDSSSAVTATLAAPGNTTYDGYEVNIKRFGAGTVHITGSSGVINIDGSSTFDLPSQYSSVTLIATGSQFVII